MVLFGSLLYNAKCNLIVVINACYRPLNYSVHIVIFLYVCVIFSLIFLGDWIESLAVLRYN